MDQKTREERLYQLGQKIKRTLKRIRRLEIIEEFVNISEGCVYARYAYGDKYGLLCGKRPAPACSEGYGFYCNFYNCPFT